LVIPNNNVIALSDGQFSVSANEANGRLKKQTKQQRFNLLTAGNFYSLPDLVFHCVHPWRIDARQKLQATATSIVFQRH